MSGVWSLTEGKRTRRGHRQPDANGFLTVIVGRYVQIGRHADTETNIR
jgi:hypothetical protein